MRRLMRGMGVVALTALVASCGGEAVAPIDDATLDVIASEAVAEGLGRGHRMSSFLARLEAEGDEETKALVAVARKHLAAARTARDDGDGELARAESRASPEALHEAARRTFRQMPHRSGARQRWGEEMEGLSEDERASMRERMKARRSARADSDSHFRMQSSEGRMERLFAAAERLGNARVSKLLEQARTEVEEARLAAEQGDDEQTRLHREALREILGEVREELPEQFHNRGHGVRGGRRSR